MIRAGRKRGAALVELALVIMFLMIVLLGIIDYGYIFFVHNSMVNAAREGARAAAVRDATADEAQKAVESQLKQFPIKFKVQVSIPQGNGAGKDVKVQVSTPVKDVSFGFIDIGELRTEVTMRRESGST